LVRLQRSDRGVVLPAMLHSDSGDWVCVRRCEPISQPFG
jgi:hypothetical protein